MQDSLPAGGLRLYREGVEPSGSLRKVSGYITVLLSRTCPVARVVYAKKPFGGPQAVLAYLSRYTHRVAISNRRLVSADETGVTFTWKDYRIEGPDRYKTMTLPTHQLAPGVVWREMPRAARPQPGYAPENKPRAASTSSAPRYGRARMSSARLGIQ